MEKKEQIIIIGSEHIVSPLRTELLDKDIIVITPEEAKKGLSGFPEPLVIHELPRIGIPEIFEEKPNYINGKKLPTRKPRRK